MTQVPRSVEEAARFAERREALLRGSHRALFDRFKQRKIELRQFAGPADHVDRLAHLRIAHLTDMHFGRVTPEKVQREAIRLTNAQHPDLVVITGDFVCHSQLYFDQLEAVLGEIEAPVLGVLGNHDYWSGAQDVLAVLRRAGIEILRNQHTTITLRGERLQVAGLDDAYTGHADRRATLKGLRRDIPAIALSHIAEEADGLWHEGLPLVLSGHTHAGQVTLARLHEIAVGRLAGHKYVHGLYGDRGPRHEDPRGSLYVGAGIGAAVMPLRLGDRGQREVALFELGLSPGSIEEHHVEQAPLPGRKPSLARREKRRQAVVAKAEKRAKKAAESATQG